MPGTRVVVCAVEALVAMVAVVVACIVVTCIVVVGLTTVMTPAIPVCFSQKYGKVPTLENTRWYVRPLTESPERKRPLN